MPKDQHAALKLTEGKNLTARQKADRAVLVALNTWLWDVCKTAAEPKTKALDPTMGPSHAFIRHVNRQADRLVRAFREAAREQARALPGRAQAGEVNRVMTAMAPMIKKVLR